MAILLVALATYSQRLGMSMASLPLVFSFRNMHLPICFSKWFSSPALKLQRIQMLAAKGAYLQLGRGQAGADSCWKAGCDSAAAPGAVLPGRAAVQWLERAAKHQGLDCSRRSPALLPFGSFWLLAPPFSYLLIGENSFIHLMGEERCGKQFLCVFVML